MKILQTNIVTELNKILIGQYITVYSDYDDSKQNCYTATPNSLKFNDFIKKRILHVAIHHDRSFIIYFEDYEFLVVDITEMFGISDKTL